jgi:dipeptidyl aminopeptidase/acylaminoacyl peptidase
MFFPITHPARYKVLSGRRESYPGCREIAFSCGISLQSRSSRVGSIPEIETVLAAANGWRVVVRFGLTEDFTMKPASRFRLAGAALVSLLCVSRALAFAPAPDADKTERIVFTSLSEDGHSARIGIVNADGSKRTILSKGNALEMDPALSPNGRRIAFVTLSKDDQKGEVWVMNADGTDRKKLVDGAPKLFTISPSWSPDGKRILYTKFKVEGGGPPAETELVVIDADGQNARSLGKGLMAVWSPDGGKIAYVDIDENSPGQEPRLRIRDADGKNDKELAKGFCIRPVWSPDGKRIAYVGGERGGESKPHIHLCNADGSDARQLTTSTEGDLAAQWSANGKRLYLTRMDPTGLPAKMVPILVIDADGKNEKELTKAEAVDMVGTAGLFVIFAASEKGKREPKRKDR